MNKGEFINYMSKKNSCTKVEAERIIDTFIGSVIEVLGEGGEISLVGFGKFHTSKMAQREGRNPRTGTPLIIPAFVQPKFSAGQKLKDACNKKK